MAQAFFSGEEIDRMKADAVRRARQMHSRSALPSGSAHKAPMPAFENRNENNASANNRKKLPGVQNLLQLSKMMGFENDQLILIALILILSGDEENLFIIIALLYIAM
ncbi:MAG: hypothetical protein UHH95_02505 [Oscillospiraceae bacterium]|nr:hypothetical protein [Oscillospiraceae bacterium]